MSDTGNTPLNRDTFQNSYSGKPPWDIGKPQPTIQALADTLTGSVLDAGCGTGENALFFASRGHAVTGFDFLEEPIVLARRKAEERGLSAEFLVKDALQLGGWTERFDNVIDCGLFHVFTDEARPQYVQGLKTVLRPGGRLFLLCFSDEVPGTRGPRRVSKKELHDSFGEGWKIESIEPSHFEVRPDAVLAMFSGEAPKAWFMLATRLPARQADSGASQSEK